MIGVTVISGVSYEWSRSIVAINSPDAFAVVLESKSHSCDLDRALPPVLALYRTDYLHAGGHSRLN